MAIRNNRKTRLLVTAGLVGALLVAAAAPASAEPQMSIPIYKFAGKCVGKSPQTQPTIEWRGGMDVGPQWPPAQHAPQGKMYFCYRVYRVGPKSLDGDTYMVNMESFWEAEDTVNEMQMAEAGHSVSSNFAAKDGEFGYTDDFLSNVSCSTPNIAISLGPISIGTELKLCSGTWVHLSQESTMRANWYTYYASRVRHIETVFYQKVAHGKLPTYTLQFRVPDYIYILNQTTGNWKVVPSWNYFNYTVQTPAST